MKNQILQSFRFVLFLPVILLIGTLFGEEKNLRISSAQAVGNPPAAVTPPTIQLSSVEENKELQKKKVMLDQFAPVNAPYSQFIVQLSYKDIDLINYSQGLEKDSRRPVASVTKLFTAVAILQLQDLNLLNIEDPVAKYFPELKISSEPVDGKMVRIAHLMNHTAGLPYASGDNQLLKSEFSNAGVWIPRQYKAAGLEFNYSNANFGILAAIIEKVSGMSYSEYMRSNIFEASGMKNSSVDNSALGYSGIQSSVNDLTVFGQKLASGEIISKRSLKQISRPPEGQKKHKDGMFYGLGARVVVEKGEVLEIYHTGIFNGNFAEMHIYFPTKSVAVLFGNPPDIRAKVFNQYRYTLNSYLRQYIVAFNQLLGDEVL